MSNKLQAAVEISEEIETQLVSLMAEIDCGDTADAYLMSRGIHRQSKVLAEKLREVAEVNNNQKSKGHELEKTQKLSEKLQSLLVLWMFGHLTENDANILNIATEINHNVLQEISRIRGE
ncbi:hypothetical protein [Xenorhabdus miraniensis]|uniref:Uncharacterized protein n=1 Tax=Xenorhabdus miraniensis TaxID=351674 RepID=A0A2D0JJI6_9GAMM|nr:hypothetical protein [Xenorhabdus miraniensis]PHM45602.1 hypothetical protein Xmir_04236 [Xenorhabdus miraniensis]